MEKKHRFFTETLNIFTLLIVYIVYSTRSVYREYRGHYHEKKTKMQSAVTLKISSKIIHPCDTSIAGATACE